MSIKLINGRGQLGNSLAEELTFLEEKKDDILIYHTWNTEDKSRDTQKKEYEKFKNFVDLNQNKKIIFISTYSEKENWYNHYKQLSEAFLSLNCEKSISLRIPIIIGKGVLQKIKKNEVTAYGKMELITTHRAAQEILKYVDYIGLIRNFRILGEKMSAVTVESIIKDI
jgi:hypothetical protein